MDEFLPLVLRGGRQLVDALVAFLALVEAAKRASFAVAEAGDTGLLASVSDHWNWHLALVSWIEEVTLEALCAHGILTSFRLVSLE